MPIPSGKDLSSLYPTPKSYDELEAERELRELDRRPRFVSIKISLWTTSGVVVSLLTYQLVSYLMIDKVSSLGEAMFAVSTSILLSLTALAALLYLCSRINNLVARVLASTTALYVALASILIVTSFTLTMLKQYQHSGALAILGVLLFNFLATHLITKSILEKQGTDHF
jgi:hypothetical protein